MCVCVHVCLCKVWSRVCVCACVCVRMCVYLCVSVCDQDLQNMNLAAVIVTSKSETWKSNKMFTHCSLG